MSEVHYVVGRQPLRVGEELKQPGEVIPHAESWRNLHTWLSWGRVERRPGPAPEKCESCGVEYPAPVELHHTEEECLTNQEGQEQEQQEGAAPSPEPADNASDEAAPTAEEQGATPAPVEQAAELLAPEQTLPEEVSNASDEAGQATEEDLADAATETEAAAEEHTEAS